MSKIDEIKERAEDACACFVAGKLDCWGDITPPEILNLCDALVVAIDQLKLGWMRRKPNRYYLAKIDQILSKGKDGETAGI